jgi:hypothetical protein
VDLQAADEGSLEAGEAPPQVVEDGGASGGGDGEAVGEGEFESEAAGGEEEFPEGFVDAEDSYDDEVMTRWVVRGRRGSSGWSMSVCLCLCVCVCSGFMFVGRIYQVGCPDHISHLHRVLSIQTVFAQGRPKFLNPKCSRFGRVSARRYNPSPKTTLIFRILCARSRGLLLRGAQKRRRR